MRQSFTVYPPRLGGSRPPEKGVSGDFEEARVWRIALRISYGSYSRLAIQEPVHRKRKESVFAPKILSSGKAKQNVIPPVMEQLMMLPNNFVVVRNVRS